MTDKKPELSAAMKSKLEPKKFTKNPIIGTSIKVVTTRNDYLHFSQIEVYGLKK